MHSVRENKKLTNNRRVETHIYFMLIVFFAILTGRWVTSSIHIRPPVVGRRL